MNLHGARRVTRDDVARIAGVSTAVVSYVLNNGPRPVSDSARERVLSAVEVTGYRVNDVARALAGGRTRIFGFAAPSLLNPFIAEIAREISLAAAERGVLMVLGDAREDPGSEDRMLRSLLQRQVDGIIYMSTSEHLCADLITGCDVPTVVFELAEDNPHLASVRIDERAAAAMTTQHLIEHGYNHFAAVVGPRSMINSSIRLSGFGDALDNSGVPRRRRHHRFAGTTREAGYVAGMDLFSSGRRVDAVFTGNEALAIGVIAAAQAHGRTVPGDLAVAGFNGSADSRYHVPALTVCRQPIRDMAETAVGILNSSSYTPTDHYFTPQLLIRRSCGCAYDPQGDTA